MNSSINYSLLLLAFSVGLLVHYLLITFSHRRGVFLDMEEKVQKVHRHPTPRIGGLGIFLAALFIIDARSTVGAYMILASIPAFFAGFLEDYSGKVSPVTRLVIMSLSPLMMIAFLPAVAELQFLNAGWTVSLILVFLLVIALMNGVNFVDGQNGIASGSVAISFAAFAYLAYRANDPVMLQVFLLLIASVAAFLIFNYPRAKIFLGDGGAYFLGFLMATAAVVFWERHPQTSPLLLLVLLIYPLWEVVFSPLRKMGYEKISPVKSDRNHLHQLLFFNDLKRRPYLPALAMLLLQLVVTIPALIWMTHDFVLFLLAFGYISLYSAIYMVQRRYKMHHRVPQHPGEA